MSALPALDTAALGRTTIYVGDCRETLRRLPAQSVHCVVTSPPYFGLRDYQTGTWEGGDPGCTHKTRRPATAANGSTLAGGKATTGHQQEGYRDVCARCGAVRVDRQIGLEAGVNEYIDTLVDVFREVWRVLRDDGTLWLNIGDSYSGSGKGDSKSISSNNHSLGIHSKVTPAGISAKNLMLIPWRLVLALQADGWNVRSVIAWTKKAPMPESVTDRPSSAWEPIFLLTKRTTYFYDAEAVREPLAESTIGRGPVDFGGSKGRTYKADMGPDDPNYRNGSEQWGRTFDYTQSSANGRNQRNVWNLSPEPFSQAHFATFPTEIPRRALLAGTSAKGVCPKCGAGWTRVTNNWQPSCRCNAGEPVPATVLDPFGGAGTTALAANRNGRHAILCELNPVYADMARRRLVNDLGMLAHVEVSTL